MTETTERFLREIVASVGADRVAELHLFPVVRQGPVEAGLAVVAAEPEPAGDLPEDALGRRHVVYTARYRHAIRGPDRGRWESSLVAEADAPLVTVDAVVRGVVRRAGEEFAPERLSGDQVRAIVRSPGAPEPGPA